MPSLRLIALAVFAAAAFGAAACGGDDTTATTATTAAATNTATVAKTVSAADAYGAMAAELEKATYPADLIDGKNIGKKDAKVVIQMYEDFTCSHCLEFTASSEPGIIENSVKTGVARLEFHYLPLRQSSVAIMVAAECAATQDKFWEYQKKLFIVQAGADAKPQEQYAQALSDGFGDTALKQYARDLGLDGAKFDDCYTNPQAAVAVVQKDLETSTTLGIRGTPGFVINGQYLANGYPANPADWKTLIQSKAK